MIVLAVSQTLSRSTKESRFIENECKQKKQLSTHWEHSHAVTYQSASNRHRRKYSPPVLILCPAEKTYPTAK